MTLNAETLDELERLHRPCDCGWQGSELQPLDDPCDVARLLPYVRRLQAVADAARDYESAARTGNEPGTAMLKLWAALAALREEPR